LMAPRPTISASIPKPRKDTGRPGFRGEKIEWNPLELRDHGLISFDRGTRLPPTVGCGSGLLMDISVVVIIVGWAPSRLIGHYVTTRVPLWRGYLTVSFAV